jgi:hypothetical protein
MVHEMEKQIGEYTHATAKLPHARFLKGGNKMKRAELLLSPALAEQVILIIFMMACALRSSPSQNLSIEGGNLLPPAMKPPKGFPSRRDRVAQ